MLEVLQQQAVERTDEQHGDAQAYPELPKVFWYVFVAGWSVTLFKAWQYKRSRGH